MRRSAALTLGALLRGLSACDALRPTTPEAGEASPATLASPASDPTPSTLSLTGIGRFDGGGAAAAEISAYDEVSRRLFVVNGALGTVDGAVNIRPWPVFGMDQPDAIAAYAVGGESYLVTANEGDARDYRPEGLTFVPAVGSPTRRPLPIVGNEVSGTTAIFELGVH